MLIWLWRTDSQLVSRRGASLVKLVRDHYLSPPGTAKVVDFANVPSYFTLDVITSLAFGEPWGFLATNSDVNDHMKTFEDMGNFIALSSDVSWIGKLAGSDIALKLFGPKITDKVGAGKMMA